MWKVLIADDEPKIRRGLKNLVNWRELDMEVVSEAEDGEMALELANNTEPDIIMADICMPFMNGLQFIEKIKETLPDVVIIVITGYDEFTYAQQAVKLQVFDYLLKPVAEEQLLDVLIKAKQKLVASRSQGRFLHWANRETEKNLAILRETFCHEWLNGQLTEEYINEQLIYLKMMLPSVAGMVLIRPLGRVTYGELLREWDPELLLFAVRNMVTELLQDQQPNIVCSDGDRQVIVILPAQDGEQWEQTGSFLQDKIESHIKQMAVVCQRRLTDCYKDVSVAYQELMVETDKKVSYTPAVLLSKKYIETYYYKEDLSLQELADSIPISPTYLSRLLKQEIGLSFIDYLIQVRVNKAIKLLTDPTIKLYEIAERVGYSNQHYFSTAFKKVTGMSPAEYRKRSASR